MAPRVTSAGKWPGMGRPALGFPGLQMCEGDQKNECSEPSGHVDVGRLTSPEGQLTTWICSQLGK